MNKLFSTALLFSLLLATSSFADDERRDHRKHKHSEQHHRHKQHAHEHRSKHKTGRDYHHHDKRKHKHNSGHSDRHYTAKHHRQQQRHGHKYHGHNKNKYRNHSHHHNCRHTSHNAHLNNSYYWGSLMLGSLGEDHDYRVYYRLDRYGNCSRVKKNRSGKFVKRVPRHKCY